MIRLCAILLLSVAACAFAATTHYVNVAGTNPAAPFITWDTASTNIQPAVDVAVDGDTVIVTDGIYRITQEVRITNAIQFASVNGFSNTAIDAQYPVATTRCLNVQNAGAYVSGFTVTNGFASDGRGGGVYMEGGALSNCLVQDNTSFYSCSNCVTDVDGGGIFATGGAVIVDCAVQFNTIDASGYSYYDAIALAGKGAGMFMHDGVVSNCVIEGNVNQVIVGGHYASAYGGGIYAAGAAVIANCVISSNTAFGYGPTAASPIAPRYNTPGNGLAMGGGVFLEDPARAQDCVIELNLADASSGFASFNLGSSFSYGGGAASGLYVRCLIRQNRTDADAYYTDFGQKAPADAAGGGAALCQLNDCVIQENIAAGFSYPASVPNIGQGGGSYGGMLDRCTLSENSAIIGGGSSGGALTNSILMGNTASNIAGGSYLGTLRNCTISGNSTPGSVGGAAGGTLDNCIIYFNTGAHFTNYDGSGTLTFCCTTPAPGGTGNITNDPLFENIVSSNFHLQFGSPCIDAAGSNSPSADLDGIPRPVDGDQNGIAVPDIGAYEYAITGQCAQSVQPTLVNVPVGVSTQSVQVFTISGCVYAASAADAWLHVVSGGTGAQNGAAAYKVDASSEYCTRTGLLSFGSATHVVVQPGQFCQADGISPVTMPAPWDGIEATTIVSVAGACCWTSTCTDSWISLQNSSGTGSGVVTYSVQGTSLYYDRTGEVVIAGITQAVIQSGAPCNYILIHGTVQATAQATTGSVFVGTPCAWTAQPNVTWLSVGNGTNVGNASFQYFVEFNDAGISRTGLIAVGTTAVIVIQQPCAFSLDVSNVIGTGFTSGQVAVTTSGGCVWTATPSAAWMILSNGSGAASANFQYTLLDFYGAVPRTGQVTVAGIALPVVQNPSHTHYVDVAGTNPAPPFLSWATAATNIQAALDVAPGGDTVIVTDGVYFLNQQIAVTNAVQLLSANGPVVTIVDAQYPARSNRCLYIGADADVVGFTFRNGCTTNGNGGGIYMQGGVLSNAYVLNNRTFITCSGCVAEAQGGGIYATGSTLVANSIIDGNSALASPKAGPPDGNGLRLPGVAISSGGGLFLSPQSIVRSTTIRNNSVSASGALGNPGVGDAMGYGGGVAGGTIELCDIVYNHAFCQPDPDPFLYTLVIQNAFGGGVFNCDVRGSLLLNNSTVAHYLFYNQGGGAAACSSVVQNCTIVQNLTMPYETYGSGVKDSHVKNSIVYGTSYEGSTFEYSYASPLPAGPGNSSTDPLFEDPVANNFHLQPGSTCIDAANAAVLGFDFDGVARPSDGNGDGILMPDMGAYEAPTVISNACNSPAVHYVDVAGTNPVLPYLAWDTAATSIQQAVDSACDGDTVTVADGTYLLQGPIKISKGILLTSVSGPGSTIIDAGYPSRTNRCLKMSHPSARVSGFLLRNGYAGGKGAGVYMEGGALSNCVVRDNINRVVLYGDYATAFGGGVYASGSARVVACTVAGNQAMGLGQAGAVYHDSSSHWAAGPGAAYGGGLYLEPTASALSCLIVSNLAESAGQSSKGGGGTSYSYGGGIYGGYVERSTISGNTVRAHASGPYFAIPPADAAGGGVSDCMVVGSLIRGNRADGTNSPFILLGRGSGVHNSTVELCTIVGNTTGGVSDSTVSGSIVVSNTGGNYASSAFAYTCTDPLPAGSGNIDVNPLFVDQLSGDFLLQASSPCIDAASPAGIFTDLDGNPRPVDGNGDGLARFDMGAYEFMPTGLCSFAMSPEIESISPSGGTGTIQVIDPSGCGWGATSLVSWIQVQSGSGIGDGTVQYNVDPTPYSCARTGLVMVGTLRHEVAQAGQPCLIDQALPPSVVIPADGGIQTVTVYSADCCQWYPTATVSWISLTGGMAGSGTGAVTYAVSSNSSSFGRTGQIIIPDQTQTVFQAGQPCTFLLTPTGIAVRANATFGSIQVDAVTDCVWAATSSVAWITVTSSTGLGPGAFTYNVAGNKASNARTGLVVVGDGEVDIVQGPNNGAATMRVDFDVDTITDIAVYWPAAGNWYIRQSHDGSLRQQNWGGPGFIPMPGDYDGDLATDIAVYWPVSGDWYVLQSGSASLWQQNWGWSAAAPAPGDYDGDGKTDLAVYDAAAGQWYIRSSSNGTLRSEQWGWSAVVPVPGDYDGDGRTDIAVYWPAGGVWYIEQSAHGNALLEEQWGWAAAVPVQADYDGDGRTDIAVFWPEQGRWYALLSGSHTLRESEWGWSESIPVPGDYDGDGQSDLTVYWPLPGIWYVQSSAAGTALIEQQWGWSEGLPVAPQYWINRWFGLQK